MLKHFVLILFLSAATVCGQSLEFGLKGGVPLTNPVQTFTGSPGSVFSDSKGYVIGVMGGLWLPLGFGVEVDALYRPLNYTTQPVGEAPTNHTDGSWEFPILGKYRFAFPLIKPYVEAGPSFRHASLHNLSLSGAGFTTGAGVEVGLLKIHVSPELRYTRWGSGSGIPPFPNLQSGQNQAEFLIGLTF